MPTDFLYIDTNFPKFSGNESLPDRVSAIQNYVFILVEQLRYSLANLDTRNWNQDALNQYGLSITEPISIQIGSMEESLTQIKIDAEGLALRVSNAEGDITQLGITAQGIQTQVSDLSGNVSTLTQTAAGLQTSVKNLEGNYSTVTQTVDGLMITTGNLNDDLKNLANGAYTSGTFISGTSIRSPNMIGGAFYSPSMESKLVLETAGNMADLLFYDINPGSGTQSIVFGVEHTIPGAAMYLSGRSILRADGSQNMCWPQGNWNFSGANVTGLNISTTATFG